MLSEFLLKPETSRRASWFLAALVVSAWGLLFAWQRSPYADLLGHEALAHHHVSFSMHLALFLLSWLLMILAMMLPVNLPVILNARGGGAQSFSITAAVVLGYSTPWVFFGLLAFLGDSLLHELTEHGGMLEMASGFIAPSIILAAGIYQLTPTKRSFTERCGQPEKSRIARAFPRGLRLGALCMGSCWALMLLMFALGHHRLDWMLIIGGFVFVERWVAWGHRLARVVGAALVVYAVGTVIAMMWT